MLQKVLIGELPALRRPSFTKVNESLIGSQETGLEDAIASIEQDLSPDTAFVLQLSPLSERQAVIASPEFYLSYVFELSRTHVLGGFQQCHWLVAHQREFPQLIDQQEIHEIQFPAFIAKFCDGVRRMPVMIRTPGKDWASSWQRVDYDGSDHGISCPECRIAVADAIGQLQ
jgi:hypothetical protein